MYFFSFFFFCFPWQSASWNQQRALLAKQAVPIVVNPLNRLWNYIFTSLILAFIRLTSIDNTKPCLHFQGQWESIIEHLPVSTYHINNDNKFLSYYIFLFFSRLLIKTEDDVTVAILKKKWLPGFILRRNILEKMSFYFIDNRNVHRSMFIIK